MIIDLTREQFYFLHQAIIKKSHEILIKQHNQGLNRNNAQLFYGYLNGKNEVRSVKCILEKTLEEDGYSLRAFRNFSINGRRLNDNVKSYNDQTEKILIKKPYLEAYLHFLGVERVDQLVPNNVSIPPKIDFTKALSLIEPKVPQRKRLYLYVLVPSLLLVFVVISRYCNPSPVFDKCKDYGNLSGCIRSPDNMDTLKSETIRLNGNLHHLPPGQEAILVIERTNTKGKKVYWYKEHTKLSNGAWYTQILEQPDPTNTEYSKEFSIVLYKVDSIKHQERMMTWIEASRPKDDREANYSPLNGVEGVPLDRIEKLVIIK